MSKNGCMGGTLQGHSSGAVLTQTDTVAAAAAKECEGFFAVLPLVEDKECTRQSPQGLANGQFLADGDRALGAVNSDPFESPPDAALAQFDLLYFAHL